VRDPCIADATLVCPGSISKLFTGIAVTQLVDAGWLDLDRDVNGDVEAYSNYGLALVGCHGSAGCGPSGTMPFGFSALIE
jgi:hypothetical protein